jgi:hypothetical protein
MVDLINSGRPEHIITIEDPIEFVHPCKKGHVNQREVAPHTKIFSDALRAALREGYGCQSVDPETWQRRKGRRGTQRAKNTVGLALFLARIRPVLATPSAVPL